MDKVIFLTSLVQCSQKKAYEMFTENRELENWLTVKAEVVPEAGGKYELFWEPENPDDNSTKGCRILAVDKPDFISFEWKGAKHHKTFMNNIRPLTNVSVSFIPKEKDQTKIVLIHTGWHNSDEWEEARIWFKNAWTGALNQLEKIIQEN